MSRGEVPGPATLAVAVYLSLLNLWRPLGIDQLVVAPEGIFFIFRVNEPQSKLLKTLGGGLFPSCVALDADVPCEDWVYVVGPRDSRKPALVCEVQDI